MATVDDKGLAGNETDRVFSPSALVGRRVEQERLRAVLEGATNGEPSALVVHGEAGIGKTRLVREACARTAMQVLWGTCVHFRATPVPFSAVRSAIDGWTEQRAEHTGSDLIPGLDELATLPQLDRAVRHITELGPTVLVIDDLQWADVSSLDLLAFLITGLRSQRLAIVATVRDDERPEGHPLRRWLPDMRRLPRFEELRLGRLDLEATAAQVESLYGSSMPPLGLPAQIYGRSGGNPYLTELLVRGGSAETGSPSPNLSEQLRDALLVRWQGLSQEARGVSRLLAHGGRPVDLDVLERVAGRLGTPPAVTGPAIREAVAAGVAEHDLAQTVWFRHPLIAEVLTDGTGAAESVPIHAAYVEVLADQVPPHAAELAFHCERADQPSEAFEWSLTAAGEAADAQGDPERLEHLLRACRLWDQAATTATDGVNYAELLLRTSRTALGLGKLDLASDLLEQALVHSETRGDVRMTCRLKVLQHALLVFDGKAPNSEVTTPLAEALTLAETLPGTAEDAIAKAALARVDYWAGGDNIKTLAAAAVEIARKVGAPEALAPALAVSAEADPEATDAMDKLNEAFRCATVSGDPLEMVYSGIAMGNVLMARGDYAAVTKWNADVGAVLVREGVPYFGHLLQSLSAVFGTVLGRWAEARELLRHAIAAGDAGRAGSTARVAMARLAVRTGNLQEATLHLARAAELASTDYRGTPSYPYGQIEALLAAGDPEASLEVVRTHIQAAAVADPRDADEFLLWAARAAADLAEGLRDRGDPDPAARTEVELARVLETWGQESAEAFVAASPADLTQPARQALYEAEVSRARSAPDQNQRWAVAAEACRRAGMPWEEATAEWRFAQAALRAPGMKAEAAASLRRSHQLAAGLGAVPLRGHVESLARASHIQLDQPSDLGALTAPSGALAGLTAREREVLAHVMAGRSNREIGKALFISEKTVSVHVSNLLRKSGTTTRGDAAAWARRMHHE